MTDETKIAPVIPNRPWYRKRRVWGGIVGGTAVVIATIPVAPVVAIGSGIIAITITTQTIATALGLIASGVFGYGQGAKVERDKQVVK